MMEINNYKIKFEVFHGVHCGMPGFPVTESYIQEIGGSGDVDPFLKVEQYLIDSRLFPTSFGYLSARVFEISIGEKIINDKKLVKIGALELMIARNIFDKKG